MGDKITVVIQEGVKDKKTKHEIDGVGLSKMLTDMTILENEQIYKGGQKVLFEIKPQFV